MTALNTLDQAAFPEVPADAFAPLAFEDDANPGDWSASGEEDGLKRSATFVTFDLGGQTFAADVSDVREILDMQPVSELPNATGDLLGMIDVRGEGLAVMDLAGLLGMRRTTEARDRRIIVLDLDLETGQVLGIVADQVRNVVDIGADQIDVAPKVPGGWTSSSLIGVTRIDGRLVYLLSLRDLLQASAADPFDFS